MEEIVHQYLLIVKQESKTLLIMDMVTPQKQVGNELIGNFVERLNSFFKPSGGSVDNAYLFIRDPEITNITCNRRGNYVRCWSFLTGMLHLIIHFGYYYYKTDDDGVMYTLI